MKKLLTNPAFQVVAAITFMIWSASPALYLFAKWHCYWFANAPACH